MSPPASTAVTDANIGITLDTYNHVRPELQEMTAKRFEEMPEAYVGKGVGRISAPEGIRTCDPRFRSALPGTHRMPLDTILCHLL